MASIASAAGPQKLGFCATKGTSSVTWRDVVVAQPEGPMTIISKDRNLMADAAWRRSGFTSADAEKDVADGFFANAFLNLLEQQGLVEALKFL